MSKRDDVLNDGIAPVGSVHAYADGLRVRVDDVRPYELGDPEQQSGYRTGDDLVSCTLYVTNGTPEAIDLDGIRLSIRCGAHGRTAREVEDFITEELDGSLDGTLRPGRTVSASWAYSIAPGTEGELDIEVSFGYKHQRESVAFTTAQAGPAAPVADPRVPAPRSAVAVVHDQSVLFGDE